MLEFGSANGIQKYMQLAVAWGPHSFSENKRASVHLTAPKSFIHVAGSEVSRKTSFP